MKEFDENLSQILFEMIHYNDDKFKAFEYYCNLGLISGSIDNVEKTCWVEDYLKWKEYYTTYKFNRKRIACPLVVSSDCVEGHEEDIAFIKIKTESGNSFWLCYNCNSFCNFRGNEELNSMFFGNVATNKEWVASQVFEEEYLDLVERGILD